MAEEPKDSELPWAVRLGSYLKEKKPGPWSLLANEKPDDPLALRLGTFLNEMTYGKSGNNEPIVLRLGNYLRGNGGEGSDMGDQSAPAGAAPPAPAATPAGEGPSLLADCLAIASNTPHCELQPLSLFVAWNGVLVLAYEGFPPPLQRLKAQLADRHPALSAEKSGSMWPKTTLAALSDDAPALTLEQLEKLRDLCAAHSTLIVQQAQPLRVERLAYLRYQQRSLEQTDETVAVPLAAPPPDAEALEAATAEERARVSSVLGEWDDLEAYLPRVNAPGSRISSYREASASGQTLAAFLSDAADAEKTYKLRELLAAFELAVGALLPGAYQWLDPASLHCTVRSLDAAP